MKEGEEGREGGREGGRERMHVAAAEFQKGSMREKEEG